MPLKTVRVPEGVEALFARAEDVVSRFFRERKDEPERGTIEIFGERYVLVGRELARAMRSARPTIRVLFMTGHSPDTMLLDGIAAAAVISKPFRAEALITKLREMLASA